MATLLVGLVIGLGGILIQALFTPKPKDSYGSRLSDINVTPVSPGNPIVRMWGTMKVTCQIIFCSPLIETMHTHQASKKGPGKGSLFGNTAKSYTFTYSVDVAFGICAGPLYQVSRIWANQKLLYVNPITALTAQADFDAAYQSEATRLIDEEGVELDPAAASAFVFAFNNFDTTEVTLTSPTDAVNYIMAHPIDDTNGVTHSILTPDIGGVTTIITQLYSGLNNQDTYESIVNRFDVIEIYLGDDIQIPNGLLQGYLGQGNAPAFRGCAYFVLTNFQLMDFGNSIPSMTAEVQQNPDAATSLPVILNDLCIEAGLTIDQFDAISNVDPTEFPGFCVTTVTSARQIIQDLQKVFPLDSAESGYKIIFSMLNTRSSQIIRRQDFGAHVDTDPLPPSEEITIVSDYDLPQRINLSYQEPARNFSKNTIYAARYNTLSTNVEDIEATVALDRTTAQNMLEQALANRMFARRVYKIFLPRKYITIEPTDVVRVVTKGQTDVSEFYEQLYCTEIQVGANGLIQAQFIDHFYTSPNLEPNMQVGIDNGAVVGQQVAVSLAAKAESAAAALTLSNAQAAYSVNPSMANAAALALAQAAANTAANAATTAALAAVPSLPATSTTQGYLYDCPLLTDSETDGPGFYVVLTGTANQWQGGAIYVDAAAPSVASAFGQDIVTPASGSAWQQVGSSMVNIPHGVCFNALAANKHSCYWDRESVITLRISNGMELVSASESDMLIQPLNVTFIGGELVQYANATDLGNGLWKVDTFLRGLKGTERLMNTHVNGEDFVRVTSGLIRIKTTQADVGQTNTFHNVSFQANNATQTSFQFMDSGNSERPWTVLVYERFRDEATGDITVKWWPRVRQNGEWLSGADVVIPTADLPETYEIDVYNAGRTAVVKTYTVSGALGGTFAYSAADQTTDLGAPSASLSIAVYMISSVIGRGFGIGTVI